MFLRPADVSGIERSWRCRYMVVGCDRGGEIPTIVVDRLKRTTLLAKEAWRARRLGCGDSLALVQYQLPTRRKVVGDQPRGIDVGHLLHRFGDLEHVTAIVNREQPFGQQDALSGTRRIVHPRARHRPNPSDAQQVGDERELTAIECEQNRTARELTLRLLNPPDRSRLERQLALEDSVRPGDCNEVELWRAAQAERERLKALATEGLRSIVRRRCPSRIGARRELHADPGHV